MRTVLVIAGALLLATASARAQDDEDIDCAHAMVQRDLNICADRDFRAADAQLNGAYRAAMARLDASGRDRLRAEERDWIAGRDRHCNAEAAEERGGSIFPMVYSGCLTEMTKARIRALQAK